MIPCRQTVTDGAEVVTLQRQVLAVVGPRYQHRLNGLASGDTLQIPAVLHGRQRRRRRGIVVPD